MVVSDFSGGQKRGCKCNKCGKKIDAVFKFRLCNKCLDELIRESDHVEMTDEHYEQYCLPPKSEVN